MERALEPDLLLGMPHLTPSGLSETWLMKELGHRHWLMLALRLGLNNADFRTADGREAYASICASSLEAHGDGLFAAKPNDIMAIRSSLAFLPRARHSSRHRLTIDGGLLCEVELISTFVARATEADNHSLARVDQALPWTEPLGTSQLASTASAMRKMAAVRQKSTDAEGLPTRGARFSPVLHQDFNGAGLLYFANFQAYFAQAMTRSQTVAARFRNRQIFFFGNVQPGQDVTIIRRQGEDERMILQDMVRQDGKIIATSSGHLW